MHLFNSTIYGLRTVKQKRLQVKRGFVNAELNVPLEPGRKEKEKAKRQNNSLNNFINDFFSFSALKPLTIGPNSNPATPRFPQNTMDSQVIHL